MDLFKSVVYPQEFWALVKFKFGGGREVVMSKVDYVSKNLHVAELHAPIIYYTTVVAIVSPTHNIP